MLDIRDLNNPLFGMFEVNHDGSMGKDVSELYMGTQRMLAMITHTEINRAAHFCPWYCTMREKTGFLWDAYNGSQMVYGSLTSAVLYSMWVHCVRDCAWAQKYVAGLSVAGMSQMDTDQIARRSSITTDRGSILVFTPDPDAQATTGWRNFTNPTDPHSLLESISKYEMRVAL